MPKCWWCLKSCGTSIPFTHRGRTYYLCSDKCVKESCKSRLAVYGEETVKKICGD